MYLGSCPCIHQIKLNSQLSFKKKCVFLFGCIVFVAALVLSLVAMSGGYSGCSVWASDCGTWAPEHVIFSNHGVQAQ